MPRPRKTGLDYFSFDVDFFSDKKIKILKARYGTNGIIIFMYLLCEIYRNGYFIVWDKDYKYIVADDLNLSDGLIEQVMTFLVERSLLSSILLDSDTILTSPGIQRRYQEAVRERAKASHSTISVDGRIWLLEKIETKPFIEVRSKKVSYQKNEVFPGNNGGFSHKKFTKESKVKKSKEKESEGGFAAPSPSDVETYIKSKGYKTFTAERFYKYYEAVGWKRNGEAITDWKALADSWEVNSFNSKSEQSRPSSFDLKELESLSIFND